MATLARGGLAFPRAYSGRLAAPTALTLSLVGPVVLGAALPVARIGVWSYALQWLLAIAVLLLAWHERLTLRALGVRALTARDLLAVSIAFVLGIVVVVAAGSVLARLGTSGVESVISRLAGQDLGQRVIGVCTAGVTEELLLRGYPIARLRTLTGNYRLAVFVSLALGLVHLPVWGVGGAFQITAWAVVITCLYAWRCSLLACSGMHLLNDSFVAFVLAGRV
jgi:membrane protease YdiL (CAAX protease family)